MPGSKVIVEIHGDELLSRELIAVGDRAGDATGAWPGVIAKLEEIEEEQFESRGARGPSGPWPKNTRDWTYWKARHGLSPELMRAHEAMYNALSDQTQASVREMFEDSLRFGADLKQFAIWQSGMANVETGNRFPVDLTREDEVEIGNHIMNYIVGPVATRPAYVLDAKGRKRIPRGMPGAGRFTK